MEANVAELVAFLVETLKQGVSFAQQQAPVWVKQMLTYGLISTTIDTIISGAVGVGLYVLLVRKYRGYKEEYGDYDNWPDGGVLMAVMAVIGTVCLVFALSGLTTIIKILTAPSLYLLQLVQEL